MKQESIRASGAHLVEEGRTRDRRLQLIGGIRSPHPLWCPLSEIWASCVLAQRGAAAVHLTDIASDYRRARLLIQSRTSPMEIAKLSDVCFPP